MNKSIDLGLVHGFKGVVNQKGLRDKLVQLGVVALGVWDQGSQDLRAQNSPWSVYLFDTGNLVEIAGILVTQDQVQDVLCQMGMPSVGVPNLDVFQDLFDLGCLIEL